MLAKIVGRDQGLVEWLAVPEWHSRPTKWALACSGMHSGGLSQRWGLVCSSRTKLDGMCHPADYQSMQFSRHQCARYVPGMHAGPALLFRRPRQRWMRRKTRFSAHICSDFASAALVREHQLDFWHLQNLYIQSRCVLCQIAVQRPHGLH